MVETQPQSAGAKERAEWVELTRPLAKRRPPSHPEQHTVTLSGTVKRGNQIGSPVDVELELTDIEFKRLTSREAKPASKCSCGPHQGPHVMLLSILYWPFAVISSLCVSFYYGSMTWYNLYIYFSEEKTIWHKIFICPLLILSFPFWAAFTAVGIALFAGCVQISWLLDSWVLEIRDLEKGFYAWFCTTIGFTQCSPYEIVVLDESDTFPDRS